MERPRLIDRLADAAICAAVCLISVAFAVWCWL
jgi:hypothetical protein